MKTTKKEEGSKSSPSSPYLSKSVYKNYESTMKEKNIKRKKEGLKPINIRSYIDWSSR